MATFLKKSAAYFIIFLAIAFKSNGQERFVLEGTIGTYPIVMLIGNDQGNLNVTYFYKKFRHDINLSGTTFVLSKLEFSKKGFDNSQKKEINLESFKIHLEMNNEWKGTWIGKKGNTLEVSLKKIDTTKYTFIEMPDNIFANNEQRIYTRARLSGLNFMKDSVTVRGKYQLMWLHEPLSKINFFQVQYGFADTLLKKINTILRRKYLSDIENYFSCTTSFEDNGDYNISIPGYFISSGFLSVHENVSWYCGGAHPGSGDNSFTIDTRTGSEIRNIDELFWFTGNKPIAESEPKYFEYTHQRAEAIVNILKQLYPVEMRKPNLADNSCDYSDASYWQFPSWYFTGKGLYIGATFPHVTRSCDAPDFSIIPYSVLVKYAIKK